METGYKGIPKFWRVEYVNDYNNVIWYMDIAGHFRNVQRLGIGLETDSGVVYSFGIIVLCLLMCILFT